MFEFEKLAKPGYKSIWNEPASAQQYQSTLAGLGFSPPEEHFRLYEKCNGFGWQHKDFFVPFFPPLEDLAEFIDGELNWYRRTVGLAETLLRFLPIANTGIVHGYLFDSTRKCLPGLYWLERDEFDFDDEDQNDSDFIHWGYDSIKSCIERTF